jgi:hypothetical protein
MIDPRKYVEQVKWEKGGRAWPNLDCYGIVIAVRADLGLEQWPAWDGVTKDGDGLDRAGREFTSARERCEPEEGALACCYTASLMTHVGVVVNTAAGLCVMECNPNTGVTCMPVRRFVRRFVRVEFFK